MTVYELASDSESIASLQKASLDESTEMGLSLEPALVGSPEWWGAIREKGLASMSVRGTISRVYWTGMNDWPEFEIASETGEKSSWTREGDISRYVVGLAVELVYVLHPWKVPHQYGLVSPPRSCCPSEWKRATVAQIRAHLGPEA